VTTGADGSFSLYNTFNCNSATQVYIVATGGNAGAGTNSAISLMAAIGPCTSIDSSTHIHIDELTTVAAAYALAPFITDYQNIGANGVNPTGLANAFAAAQFLVSTSTGGIATPPTGFTLPVKSLNTLGNVLAACVNSNGPSSTMCSQLLSATSATETIGAALSIARSPGSASSTALYSLSSTVPPYGPAFTSQPNDFTLAVKYSGAELNGPYGIALDANGSAWVTNVAGASVVKLPALASTFATSTYSAGGLLGPRGISLDKTGNVWIANTGGDNIVELSGIGTVLSGTGFSGGGISGPVSIGNDSAGNAWVANFFGNSITELSASGTTSGASLITGTSVCSFSNAAVLQSCLSDSTLFGATSVAVSKTGSVALAGSTTGATVAGAFTLASNTGTVNPLSPVTGGGIALPQAVTFDGAGTAWFANTASISAFSGTSPATGTQGLGSVSSPNGIAVDPSGSVWTANTGDNSVAVFIGLATPVKTPLAANVGP
jgi:streptogramin lyase